MVLALVGKGLWEFGSKERVPGRENVTSVPASSAAWLESGVSEDKW